MAKLNAEPISGFAYDDATLTLSPSGPAPSTYPFAVYAYVIRAVNALGVESGPSPYQLTIPSPPQMLMIDDTTNDARLKWEPPVEGAVSYRIYAIPGSGQVVDVTPY